MTRAALLALLLASPASGAEGEPPFATFSPFTRVPARAGTYPGYVAGGAVGAALCIPLSLKSGAYGMCTVQMADAFSNALGTVVGAPFALLEWAFWRGPRRLMSKDKAAAKGAPPPPGLMLVVKLPPNTRFVGGLSGPLRIEPGESMTHAVEHDGKASPVTFGYDQDVPALVVDEESLPGGRAVYPLRPPYPLKLRLTIGGVAADIEVTPSER